jgi:hypothetical protein
LTRLVKINLHSAKSGINYRFPDFSKIRITLMELFTDHIIFAMQEAKERPVKGP